MDLSCKCDKRFFLELVLFKKFGVALLISGKLNRFPVLEDYYRGASDLLIVEIFWLTNVGGGYSN
jgi:hypothetical protein